jgi:hypothetical protein
MIELNLIGFVKFIFVIVLLIIYFISFLDVTYVKDRSFFTCVNFINVFVVYFIGVSIIINLFLEKFFG